MRYLMLILLLFSTALGFSQVPDEEELYLPAKVEKDTVQEREYSFLRRDNDTLIKTNDLRYREDQFYLALTYNLFQNRTQDISQSAFSAGLSLGFLRDFPINKDRDIAIAVGAGYSYNDFRSNLHISEVGDEITYQIAENFDKNQFTLHYFEVPLEFRWRTSTPKNTRFWRIYTGVKFSYLFYDRSQIIGENFSERVKNNPDFNKAKYSVYLSVGHGGFNFYINYTLNPIFKNAYLNGESIELTSLNLGIIFYFL